MSNPVATLITYGNPFGNNVTQMTAGVGVPDAAIIMGQYGTVGSGGSIAPPSPTLIQAQLIAVNATPIALKH